MAQLNWIEESTAAGCHDAQEFTPQVASWGCCDMVFPLAYNFCPICGRGQWMEDDDVFFRDFD